MDKKNILNYLKEHYKEFQTAFQTANTYTWDKKELNYYDKVSLKKGDDKNALITAENKGIKKEKINIAKNLLDILDDETISLKTALSVAVIKNLR